MRERYGLLAVLVFCVLNWFKYDYRAGLKDNNSIQQDYSKSMWYLSYYKSNKQNLNWFERLLAKYVLRLP